MPPWLTQVLPGQLVSAEPELCLVELDPSLDRFVVLACDGIWDVLQAGRMGGGCQDMPSMWRFAANFIIFYLD